jgi:hypothetical protein
MHFAIAEPQCGGFYHALPYRAPELEDKKMLTRKVNQK